MSFIDEVTFDEQGLVPAIAQDAESKTILMVAWMNRDALLETVNSKKAVYWSRSRQRLWRKGEESGHEQIVHSVALDCDSDVVLLQVTQKGGIACHTGRQSCFFRELQEPAGQAPNWESVTPVLKDPNEIYKK